MVQLIIGNTAIGLPILLAVNPCTTLAQLYKKGPDMQWILKYGSFDQDLGLTHGRKGSQDFTNIGDLQDHVIAI